MSLSSSRSTTSVMPLPSLASLWSVRLRVNRGGRPWRIGPGPSQRLSPSHHRKDEHRQERNSQRRRSHAVSVEPHGDEEDRYHGGAQGGDQGEYDAHAATLARLRFSSRYAAPPSSSM